MTDKYYVDDIYTISDLGMLSFEADREANTCSNIFDALVTHVYSLTSMMRGPKLDSPIEVDKHTLQYVIDKYSQSSDILLSHLEQLDKRIADIEEIFEDME